VLPFYISIGMTPAEFWYGDVELARAYRKAYEYKKEQWNTQAWLNGLYVYDALLRASPILRDFAKKGTKPMPYRDKPVEITTSKEQEKQREINKGKELQDKMVKAFERFNAGFRKKKEKR